MDNRLRGERRRRRRRSIRSGRAHFNWNSHDDRPSVPATDHKVLSTDWQSFVQLFSKSRWRTKVSAGLEIDIRPFLDRTESFLIYLISIQITLNLQINIDTSSQSRKVSGQRKKKKKKKKNSVHWLIKGHFQKLCCQGTLLSSNRYCPRCGISPARMLSEKFSAKRLLENFPMKQSAIISHWIFRLYSIIILLGFHPKNSKKMTRTVTWHLPGES